MNLVQFFFHTIKHSIIKYDFIIVVWMWDK